MELAYICLWYYNVWNINLCIHSGLYIMTSKEERNLETYLKERNLTNKVGKLSHKRWKRILQDFIDWLKGKETADNIGV